ncbi:MAG: hypothetical protein Q8L86_01105 [Vicinamibacterales bacterium]|nr:hypothetical protein [Vicinamibacterales bacterium]
MPRSTLLKRSLKRGALVTVANWPLVAMQFVADAVFKTLVAVPIVGGILLVMLLVGVDPAELLRQDPREVVPTLAAVLLAQPVALAAFLIALGVVLVGASVFMFAVKSGSVAVLVEADAAAGPIEQPPLRLATIRRAERFSLDRYTSGVRRLFPRFLVLGVWLFAAYALVGVGYVALVFGPMWTGSDLWPFVAAAASTAVVVVITIINWLYLLMQMAIGADDIGVARAATRVWALLRRSTLGVVTVFAAALVLVVLTTAASILATAALGLIAFVPIVGLAAVPLQAGAWLLRGIVFQFLGLTALVAYLHLYREGQRDGRIPRARRAPEAAS